MQADTSCVPSECTADALYRRVTLRLLPFLMLCYMVAVVDRLNIAMAKLQMLPQLGFSEATYGLGAGMFFIGYLLFDVPSNMILHRVGARWWLGRIMITWGLVSAGTAFVSTPLWFYALRFLLGLAEAGFFAGLLLYAQYWFPASRRGRIYTLLVVAVPLASVVGNPLAGWIMSGLDRSLGLAGWQWLFLLEGLPRGLRPVLLPPTRQQDRHRCLAIAGGEDDAAGQRGRGGRGVGRARGGLPCIAPGLAHVLGLLRDQLRDVRRGLLDADAHAPGRHKQPGGHWPLQCHSIAGRRSAPVGRRTQR